MEFFMRGKTMFFRKKEKITEKPRNYIVKAPIGGKLKDLQALNDGVFSEQLLGKGCVICSDDETIYSPFDGNVVMTTESKHAIGLLSSTGVELLIHVGLDTVMMNGQGFEVNVKKGDSIHTGQKLMSFSKKKIKEAGYVDDVIVIVSNTKQFKDVVCTNQKIIRVEEELLTVII